MADITLSAGVRQNLLSLQSTADLMAQTQNRLATGKKVNSALDNPISYFTSQSLNNRASDLNALLDSISNATQTLQAANNGLTSLTKLVQSAQAIAQQALQSASTSATVTGSVAGLTGRDVITVHRQHRHRHGQRRHHHRDLHRGGRRDRHRDEHHGRDQRHRQPQHQGVARLGRPSQADQHWSAATSSSAARLRPANSRVSASLPAPRLVPSTRPAPRSPPSSTTSAPRSTSFAG